MRLACLILRLGVLYFAINLSVGVRLADVRRLLGVFFRVIDFLGVLFAGVRFGVVPFFCAAAFFGVVFFGVDFFGVLFVVGFCASFFGVVFFGDFFDVLFFGEGVVGFCASCFGVVFFGDFFGVRGFFSVGEPLSRAFAFLFRCAGLILCSFLFGGGSGVIKSMTILPSGLFEADITPLRVDVLLSYRCSVRGSWKAVIFT